MDPEDQMGFLYWKKRAFVNSKYNIGSAWTAEDETTSYFAKIPNNNNQTMAAPCVNEGFESNVLAPWVGTRGTNSNSCNYPSTPISIPLGAPFLQINTTPFVDPIVGIVPNSPFPGNKVLRLNDNNNTNPFFSVVKVSQQFSVTTTNFLYEFAYIMIASGSNHSCCDMPYMYVRIRDAINILQTCPNFSILPPSISAPTCPGIGPTTWTTVAGNTYNQGWQKYSIDLTPYMNQNVTVEVFVSDCSQGAHFGYGYFDSNCNTFGITVNNSTVFPAPTQTVNVTAPCGTTATLTAPTGLNPYNWNGPPLSAIVNNTNQTISTPVPGDYTLTMNPTGVCNPIVRIVRLSFVPPLGAFATPTAICTAGSNSTAVLTATGATTYTWSTSPPVFTSTVAVSPTATTIYTVTGTTSTCTTTQTLQVLVNTSPTVAVSSSSNVLCSGGGITLTASGATNYTWLPGNTTGSTAVVSPTASTNYTVLGANGGCPGQATIGITVIGSPTVSAFSSAATVCAGGSANLFAGGAFTYTWQPGNLVGAVVSVTPPSTTIYTVTGQILSCFDTETVQVSVSNGPTVNITATPTTVCSSSGGTAALVASGAVSYTWNPGFVISPTLVITPTTTTVYTVTAASALLCLSTTTISFSVTPTPTLNIVPSSAAICAGSSATLTGSGAANYTWMPGSMTTPVVVVTPVANTTYTLTGANGTCTSSLTVSLTVNPNPTVSASSSPTVVCSGNSSTLSGTGAVSYTWNPGSLNGTTVAVTPASTTNYTVTGANAFACTSTAVVQVSVNISPTLNPIATPASICVGNSATLSTGGATTYTWNPGNMNGASVVVSPIITTVYTVTGSNGNCTDTKTVQLIVNPIPTVSAVSNPTVICAGGSATLTGSGATTYTWNPGSLVGTNVTVSPTVTTQYTVVGSNGTCTGSAVVSLSVNGTPTLTASSNPTSYCAGSATTATLTGTGALTYTWNPGNLSGATVTVSPLVTTTYTLGGTNAAGCSSNQTVNVVVIPIPTLNISASSTAICAGNSTTLTGSGATTYTWNPGALTGATVSVSPATNTTYTLTGGNGSCTSTATISVVVNANPTITANSSPTLVCSGSTSTLSAVGALTYTWNPGSLFGSPVIVAPLITTNYTVTGSNAAGCTATAVAQVSINTTPTINPIATPTAICVGSTATLSSTGATTYTWNPGNLTGTSVTVSPASTQIYTVTGSNGICTDTKTVQLVVNPIPTVSAISNPTVICAANPATLTGSGATSYTWIPGPLLGTNVVVNPTVTTTYTVIGSSLSCTSTATVVVNVNATPTVIASATPTNICSGTGGSATLSAVGAVSYIWNPGTLIGSPVVVTPTTSTTYTVIGSSPAGCLGTATVFIQITPTPTLSPIASPSSICAGASSTLSTTGATTYTWMPGSLSGSSVVVSPIVNTIYTVTGTNGICNSSATVAVNINPNPTVNAVSNPTAICIGNTATLTGSGASTYTWNPGLLVGTSVTVSPAATTVYSVLTTNSLGCTGSTTVQLIVNPLPTVTAVANPTGICQGSGGSSTLTASGASTYTWNPGPQIGTTVVVTPTATTVYTVTGTSSLGCTSTRTLQVQIIPNPTVTPSATPAVICSGSSSTLTVTGATTYTWLPGPTTGSTIVVNPTTTTIYTVTGSNAQCISSSKTVQVIVNPTPTMNLNTVGSSTICSGSTVTIVAQNVVSATLIPGPIIGGVVFQVSPPVTTIYTITGSNAFGCTNTKTIQITVNPTPTIIATASPSTICNGGSTTLSAIGATSYTWLPVAVTGGTIVVTPTATTIYTVIGMTGFCSSTRTVQVNVGTTPTITATASPTLKCGPNPATLTATGATSYTWYPGAQIGATVVVNPFATTVYTVVGANGSCTSIATVTLFFAPIPFINTFANPINICSGSSSTLGAIGAASYTWNPGSVVGQTIVVTPSVTTVYTVTGANAAGCTNTATRVVNVTPSPTIIPVANPTVLCAGNSATLTVTGANNYTWFPGPTTGSNIVVTPTATTIYTVTGNIGPCTNTKTLSLVVNPSPTIAAGASSTLVCANTAVTLSAGGGISYTWQPGPIAGGTVVVAPLVTTVYTVTGSNAGGCTQTAVVTVSTLPGPSITVVASSNSICSGSSVTLTPSGANTYTLFPSATPGTVFVVSPTVTSTYTILGSSSAGCPGVSTVQVIVNPIPVVTITTAPSNSICVGTTVTLTALGASTYTWLTAPIALTSTIIDTPTVTTLYTVVASSTAGCVSSQTAIIYVTPIPTINVSSSTTLVCQSGTVSLTATGATNYTWMPGSLTGSNVVVTPTTTTIYTVSGNNGGCNGTATVQINVTPGPQSVTASSTGSITCFVSSVGLLGSTTSTNVSYLWNGPASYTSSVQNPTPITTPGVYTLTVVDLDTGCPLSVTCAVSGNTTIPNFSVSVSGNLGCNTTVTLMAYSSATAGITYTWSGPGSFTSAVQNPTINIGGDYTVSAFDLATGCVGMLTISVLTDTSLPIISATIIPATCNGTVSNNDGTIILGPNGVKYDLVIGSTYTGTSTYLTAIPIPTNGVITSTLANPGAPTPYTVRIYGFNGCFKDTTMILDPINCFNNVFGLTKAASTPSLINNKYEVTFTVTAVNNSFADLSNITLNENLDATFVLPTTYTVVNPPVVTSQGSSLTINPLFNGSSQFGLTVPATSTLVSAHRDTIVFTVRIEPNGFFGTYFNSVIGFATDINSLVVSDSSNDGFLWDPDADGLPTNNNVPTPINLAPNTRLGIAKAGKVSQKLSDDTYDITYVITVKNFGNDTLKMVQVRDSLARTVPLPANFTIKNAPSITGTLLTANTAFNGISDMNLLSGINSLAPGQVDSIRFTINVTPDSVTVFRNTAMGYAINQFSTAARDSSQNGNDPDVNGNGNPNETSDSDPTVIVIPSSEFFIPEVFTPNDDGKNDKFVIKGLAGKKVKLTVFNRWGNKVYERSEYDNSWDGYPNAKGLIVGNDKLPQGTYYYILEFSDGENKPVTGYVVLQY